MLQSEFMKKVNDENIKLDKLQIVIGRKINVPYSLGCYEENNIWKIYDVDERQRFGVVKSGN